MAEQFKEIISSSTPTLVDFYATWCAPCQRMHPILEELKTALGDKVRIIKVDVDKNEALAQEFNVQSIPSIFIFKNGEIHWRQVGLQRLSILKQAVEDVLNT